jgi:exosortase A-associated hydrolase 2
MVLHVHGFAEELNKCRRMTALMARELAMNGWAVLQIDLLGCGDSSAEFGQADWTQWIEDVRAAYRWMRVRYQGPSWIWCLRAGCLIGVEAMAGIEGANFLFWQPVHSGRQHLTQFLRMRLANEMLGSTAARSGTSALRGKVLAGETLEIAGYELSSGLAAGLDSAELNIPVGSRTKVIWLEVSPGEPVALLPISLNTVARFQEQGRFVRTGAVRGSPFWQTVEITECPALLEETLKALSEETP